MKNIEEANTQFTPEMEKAWLEFNESIQCATKNLEKAKQNLILLRKDELGETYNYFLSKMDNNTKIAMHYIEFVPSMAISYMQMCNMLKLLGEHHQLAEIWSVDTAPLD